MRELNLAEIEKLIENADESELDKILAQLNMADDFPTYSANILKVQTPQSKIVPFKLNGPQLILHKIIEEHIRPHRLIRILALKARRMGFSTYFSGRFYQNTSCNPNRYAIQITHEPDATDFLFKMVKRFYNLCPTDFKPSTLYNNARLLEFNTQDGTGLNSAFRVATAGKDDVGSGQLLHCVHFSEVAKYPQGNIKDLLTSILQCIPDEDGTEIVYESTAKGIGGEFYDRFWNARFRIWVSRLDENGEAVIEESINEETDAADIYTSIFLPWFCYEAYHLDAPEKFKRTEAEELIVEKFGVNNDQLHWRRWVLANKCDGNIDTFNQEYPADPRMAFLGSGRPVFDNLRIMEEMEAADPPATRYELHANNWIQNDLGRLRVWEEPYTEGAYIISADVAEGLREGDYSCADVIDHRTGKHVAQWHGHIDCDNVLEFADILAALGRRYNTALVAPERNNHGLGVVTQLFHSGYPRLYHEMVPDPPAKPRKRYGWVTSRSTRPLILDNLIREVVEGTHGIKCKETFEEMLTFKIQDNGKMEADSNRHDDRVISYAIGKHIRQTSDLPAMRRNSHHKQRRVTGQGSKNNPKGWT